MQYKQSRKIFNIYLVKYYRFIIIQEWFKKHLKKNWDISIKSLKNNFQFIKHQSPIKLVTYISSDISDNMILYEYHSQKY